MERKSLSQTGGSFSLFPPLCCTVSSIIPAAADPHAADSPTLEGRQAGSPDRAVIFPHSDRGGSLHGQPPLSNRPGRVLGQSEHVSATSFYFSAPCEMNSNLAAMRRARISHYILYNDHFPCHMRPPLTLLLCRQPTWCSTLHLPAQRQRQQQPRAARKMFFVCRISELGV